MTIDGLTKLLKMREMLARQKEFWENELKNVDSIRAIRFYQPNPTERAPRSERDENYSSYISSDNDDSIFWKLKTTYRCALENKIASLESDISHLDSLMDQAETLLSEIPEE